MSGQKPSNEIVSVTEENVALGQSACRAVVNIRSAAMISPWPKQSE